MKGVGFCGRHAATKIMSKISSAPTAIPKIAALDIVAASKIKMVKKVYTYFFILTEI